MSMLHERLGYHFYPDDRHYTQADLATWLPILDRLGARWLTLRASPERAVPESFVRGLKEAGLEPLVHIPIPVASFTEADLLPLMRSYARWGVKYVVLFDRPNLRAKWSATEWAKTGLVERFLDAALPVLHAQRSAGLRPVLPPLEPGGDYWDTAFLGSILEGIARRGQTSLQADLTLGIYAWTYGRPLTWGAGGPERWPEARPYHTPEGCQDQLGLRVFEWYAAMADSAGHADLKMLVIAGGALRSLEGIALVQDLQTEQNIAIARALENAEIPKSVLNFAFYPLTTAAGHPDHSAAWFPSADQPQPVVAALGRLSAGAPKKPTSGPEKPIKHYLLLPSGKGASFAQEWDALAEFTASHQPAIGFSPQEARLAEVVTIAGGEDVVPLEVEQQLRAAGCRVHRLSRNAASASSASSSAFAESQRPTYVEAGISHA